MPAAHPVAFRFTPNIRLLVLGLSFLPLLVSLGFWQLSRAAEKQQMLSDARQLSLSAPLDISRLAGEQLTALAPHTPVVLTGTFHPTLFWLLDNQVYHGQVGYRLLQPVQTDKTWLLIDRGWIAGYPDRRLPVIDLAEDRHLLTGKILQPGLNLMNQAAMLTADDPRILDINLANLRLASGLDLQAVVQLDAVSATALVVVQSVVNVHPEKHRAYAVQWFCMAAALLILLVCTNTTLLPWLGLQQSNNNDEV